MFRVPGIALAALLALSGAAQAGEYGINDRPRWDPPARYDKPYEGRLIEYQLEQQAVRRYCASLSRQFGRRLNDSPHLRGCALRFPEQNTCIIVYISHRYGLASPEAVRRHEIGHCNGWPGHHPD